MELLQLPRLLSLHPGGRKVYREAAPFKVVEASLPVIKKGAAKLKKKIEAFSALLEQMQKDTEKEKKVYEAHLEKLDLLKADLPVYEALIAKVDTKPVAAPKAKAKK